jgi:hypothetical protein
MGASTLLYFGGLHMTRRGAPRGRWRRSGGSSSAAWVWATPCAGTSWACRASGLAGARSRSRVALPPIHFVPDSLRWSVPLLPKRQCDRTPGPASRGRPTAASTARSGRRPPRCSRHCSRT